MPQNKTIKAKLEPILNYVDLGTISEDIWDRAYAIHEHLDANELSPAERERLCDILRDIAGRILLVAQDLQDEK